MKSAVIIDRVDLTVTDLDMRSNNQAIALLARVFSMCSNELVRVFAEPDLFEPEVCSYIRVGIPGMGVLCVDSTDAAARLVVADRELALAFADVLAMPGRVKLLTFALLPAGSRELRNREEAVQQ